MAEGQVLAENDKKCPECAKRYKRIADRDKDAAVLECACGRRWTVFYQQERP